MSPRRVAIVPHTHWDREWYSPFQAFRLRLVDLLDEFLPRLEADPSYARFLLDGQMAVVDDYLAVRPEAEARLRRLGASGRLALGPWYILMDEFLVSGETMVRNLQYGMERAAAFGGAMPVGYLPDMFGHVAQMPQILALAGFQHAVVWRGVPSAVDKTAFWWEALDGSRVRAEYLWVGYSNGSAMPEDAKALVRRINTHAAELGDALLPDAGLLWMNGTDHQVPQSWLGRVVAEANTIQDDYRLAITSLAEFLAAGPTDGLPTWRGELRSGARASLLMGVASNRVDVKQAAAWTERSLERQAEPLSALFLPSDAYPEALLRLAWTEVIRNSAHDSICACSVDQVGAAVLHRFDEAYGLAEGLRRRAERALADTIADAGPVVINASARPRRGLVEVVVAGDGPVEGTQLVRALPAAAVEVSGLGRDLGALLGELNAKGFRVGGSLEAIDIDEGDDEVRITFRVGRSRQPRSQLQMARLDAARAETWAVAGSRGESRLVLRAERQPSQTLLVQSAEVPGFGWSRWRPGPLNAEPATATDTSLENGLIGVEVDPATGTFAIDGHAGLDLLVDGGDEGDTYNYSPPAIDTVVDRPTSVRIERVETGPLRARLRVIRTFEWPERIVEGERVGSRPVTVTSELELHAGERLVRVDTVFENPSRDHRLRAWFPLPHPATFSRAECAFGIVERGLEAEGGRHERGLPTFPSRRFVTAGGLTVVHEGLLEYELVDGGRALALTLLRATGMLSRDHMAYRPDPAGPAFPVEGPQLIGPRHLRYGVQIGDADPYALVDQAFLPLTVLEAPGGGHRPEAGSALTVDGAEVSALHRVAGALELRVFNPTDRPATVRVAGRRGWLVNLRGQAEEPFYEVFALRPWGIATARLEEG
jgi:hypothetical protein